MENYILRNDETILFKSQAKLHATGNKCIQVETLLTNLNFVFVHKKKFLSKTVNIETYDVNSVKIYDSTYQIIRKNKMVEIYLVGTEKLIEFPSVKLAKEFTNASLRLVSGYSKLVRGVKKAQKAVAETEKALNIDISQAIKITAVTVGGVAIEVAGMSGAGKKTKLLGNIAKGIMHSKTNAEPKQIDKPLNNEEDY